MLTLYGRKALQVRILSLPPFGWRYTDGAMARVVEPPYTRVAKRKTHRVQTAEADGSNPSVGTEPL